MTNGMTDPRGVDQATEKLDQATQAMHFCASLASNACCLSELLSSFAYSENYWVRLSTAGNRNSTPSAFAALAEDRQQNIRAAVGRNSSTPPTILMDLINRDEPNPVPLRSPNPWPGQKNVSASVAGNQACPSPVFDLLVNSVDPRLRVTIAANQSCPVDHLTFLAADQDRSVRRAVGGNATSPSVLLRSLAHDVSLSVRTAVIRNPACPEDVIRNVMSRDSVLHSAQRRREPNLRRIS